MPSSCFTVNSSCFAAAGAIAVAGHCPGLHVLLQLRVGGLQLADLGLLQHAGRTLRGGGELLLQLREEWWPAAVWLCLAAAYVCEASWAACQSIRARTLTCNYCSLEISAWALLSSHSRA